MTGCVPLCKEEKDQDPFVQKFPRSREFAQKLNAADLLSQHVDPLVMAAQGASQNSGSCRRAYSFKAVSLNEPNFDGLHVCSAFDADLGSVSITEPNRIARWGSAAPSQVAAEPLSLEQLKSRWRGLAASVQNPHKKEDISERVEKIIESFDRPRDPIYLQRLIQRGKLSLAEADQIGYEGERAAIEDADREIQRRVALASIEPNISVSLNHLKAVKDGYRVGGEKGSLSPRENARQAAEKRQAENTQNKELKIKIITSTFSFTSHVPTKIVVEFGDQKHAFEPRAKDLVPTVLKAAPHADSLTICEAATEMEGEYCRPYSLPPQMNEDLLEFFQKHSDHRSWTCGNFAVAALGEYRGTRCPAEIKNVAFTEHYVHPTKANVCDSITYNLNEGILSSRVLNEMLPIDVSRRVIVPGDVIMMYRSPEGEAHAAVALSDEWLLSKLGDSGEFFVGSLYIHAANFPHMYVWKPGRDSSHYLKGQPTEVKQEITAKMRELKWHANKTRVMNVLRTLIGKNSFQDLSEHNSQIDKLVRDTEIELAFSPEENSFLDRAQWKIENAQRAIREPMSLDELLEGWSFVSKEKQKVEARFEPGLSTPDISSRKVKSFKDVLTRFSLQSTFPLSREESRAAITKYREVRRGAFEQHQQKFQEQTEKMRDGSLQGYLKAKVFQVLHLPDSAIGGFILGVEENSWLNMEQLRQNPLLNIQFGVMEIAGRKIVKTIPAPVKEEVRNALTSYTHFMEETAGVPSAVSHQFAVDLITDIPLFYGVKGAALSIREAFTEEVTVASVRGSQLIPADRLDYSSDYLASAKEFISPKEFKGTFSRCLTVVRYHEPTRGSFKYWAPASQCNAFSTMEQVYDKLALLEQFGAKTHVAVAEIPAGVPVKFLHGRAASIAGESEFRAGGAVQYRFESFDPSWIRELRELPKAATSFQLEATEAWLNLVAKKTQPALPFIEAQAILNGKEIQLLSSEEIYSIHRAAFGNQQRYIETIYPELFKGPKAKVVPVNNHSKPKKKRGVPRHFSLGARLSSDALESLKKFKHELQSSASKRN